MAVMPPPIPDRVHRLTQDAPPDTFQELWYARAHRHNDVTLPRLSYEVWPPGSSAWFMALASNMGDLANYALSGDDNIEELREYVVSLCVAGTAWLDAITTEVTE